MIVAVSVVAVLLVLLLRRRARSKRVLAGLEATRPTFQVDPPRRRLGKRARELL